MLFYTTWRQDPPLAKRLWLALWWHSLYCSSLEWNLQYPKYACKYVLKKKKIKSAPLSLFLLHISFGGWIIPSGSWQEISMTRYLKATYQLCSFTRNFQNLHAACIHQYLWKEAFLSSKQVKRPCPTAFTAGPSYTRQCAKYSTLDSPKYTWEKNYWPSFIMKNWFESS